MEATGRVTGTAAAVAVVASAEHSPAAVAGADTAAVAAAEADTAVAAADTVVAAAGAETAVAAVVASAEHIGAARSLVEVRPAVSSGTASSDRNHPSCCEWGARSSAV